MEEWWGLTMVIWSVELKDLMLAVGKVFELVAYSVGRWE